MVSPVCRTKAGLLKESNAHWTAMKGEWGVEGASCEVCSPFSSQAEPGRSPGFWSRGVGGCLPKGAGAGNALHSKQSWHLFSRAQLFVSCQLVLVTLDFFFFCSTITFSRDEMPACFIFALLNLTGRRGISGALVCVRAVTYVLGFISIAQMKYECLTRNSVFAGGTFSYF